MRTISKRPEPVELATWRARYAGDPNFGYDLMRKDRTVREAVETSLADEQGGLDAYTGQRIRAGTTDPSTGLRKGQTCHIEHLIPQWRSKPGEDAPGSNVQYANMVACFPAPDTGRAPYGAHRKDDWPPLREHYLFVSPLSPGCEDRFSFKLNGEMIAADLGDQAAARTIQELGLSRYVDASGKVHRSLLDGMRREAIEQALGKDQSLSAAAARTKLRDLDDEVGDLTPFCFAVRQALQRQIRRIGHIRAQKRKKS